MRYLTLIFLIIGCSASTQVTQIDEEGGPEPKVGETAAVAEETFFITENFDEVLRDARRSKRPIIIHFGADWCLPCKQMRRITYKDAKVKSAILEGFIPYRVDVDYFVGMDIADRYRVKKYPTVITLDYKGNITSFNEGYLSPDQLLGIIN